MERASPAEKTNNEGENVNTIEMSVTVTFTTSRAGGRHNMPPPPASWPFDLESGVRVTCDVGYLSVPILVFLGLSVLDLGPMYATDRQTDRQTRIIARLMPPTLGAGA